MAWNDLKTPALNAFGESITYSAGGTTPVPITAIIERRVSQAYTDRDGQVVSADAIATVDTSQVASPAEADSIVAGGVTYYVDRILSVAAGLARLALRSTTPARKAAGGGGVLIRDARGGSRAR